MCRLLALGLFSATLCRAEPSAEPTKVVEGVKAAPFSTLVPSERMQEWLERACAHNAQLIQIVQQMKRTGDVDSARATLKGLADATLKLADDGDIISACAEAEGIPLHERKDLHSMLSEYRLKLETLDAELNFLMSETDSWQKLPELKSYIYSFTVKVRSSDFLHADTQKRLIEYAPKAYALAQEIEDCLDQITDADSAARMAVRYAELRRELSICVGIINNYIIYDLEGALQGGLCDRLKEKLTEQSKEFEKKLPRLVAADYYGCEPLRALLAPIVARMR